jgi:hypothetical protein
MQAGSLHPQPKEGRAVIDRDTIARAKIALPMPDLWRKLGWPGEPMKSCLAPWETAGRPSFSVFQKGDGSWAAHDFRAGETFDEIALLARVEGLDNAEACRRFLSLAGVSAVPAGPPGALPGPPMPRPRPPDAKPACKPYVGTLRGLSREECKMIAASRGLLPDAVILAAADGLLWHGERLGWPSWVLTDAERWNAQFRRMDGAPYVLSDGREVKTLGVKAGWAAWPLGLPALASGSYRRAVMVEGLPDALAAFQVLLESGNASGFAVLCMVGSGLRIPAECLPHFAGVRVRIFCDADESGRRAAVRWERQLREAGAVVDAFDLGGLLQADGKPVKDLNDACRMATEERAALGLMEGMNDE